MGPAPDLEPVHGRATVALHRRGRAWARPSPGADALLLWDFFSTALRDAGRGRARCAGCTSPRPGVDTLLFDELIDSDVVVTNARGVFDRPMAEFALASILARVKRLHEIRDRQRARHWRHQETETAGRAGRAGGRHRFDRPGHRAAAARGRACGCAGPAAPSATDDPDFGDGAGQSTGSSSTWAGPTTSWWSRR